MAAIDRVQSFEARLALYSLDTRARRLVRETWPLIAPNLDRAIDEILRAVSALPIVGAVVAQNREFLKKLEAAHFTALLGGNLEEGYAEFLPAHRRAGSGSRFRRAHPQHRRELRAQGGARRARPQIPIFVR